MPELTLYRANGSCALGPHCLLTELGVPFKTILMKFGPDGVEAADGSISHQEYLSIHPAGYVPALMVDGEVITEMPAVLNYISSLAPDKNLSGEDAFQRAKVVEWTAWLSGSLHAVAYGMRFRPGRFTDNLDLYPEVRQKGEDYVEKAYARINERLRGRVFAVGSADTVVDYNLVIFWHWGQEIGLQMHERFPNYGALVERMESKESVAKVINTEGMRLAFSKP